MTTEIRMVRTQFQQPGEIPVQANWTRDQPETRSALAMLVNAGNQVFGHSTHWLEFRCVPAQAPVQPEPVR